MLETLLTLQENTLFATSITQSFLRELESPSRIFHRKRRETDTASLDNRFPEKQLRTLRTILHDHFALIQGIFAFIDAIPAWTIMCMSPYIKWKTSHLTRICGFFAITAIAVYAYYKTCLMQIAKDKEQYPLPKDNIEIPSLTPERDIPNVGIIKEASLAWIRPQSQFILDGISVIRLTASIALYFQKKTFRTALTAAAQAYHLFKTFQVKWAKLALKCSSVNPFNPMDLETTVYGQTELRSIRGLEMSYTKILFPALGDYKCDICAEDDNNGPKAYFCNHYVCTYTCLINYLKSQLSNLPILKASYTPVEQTTRHYNNHVHTRTTVHRYYKVSIPESDCLKCPSRASLHGEAFDVVIKDSEWGECSSKVYITKPHQNTA